MRNPWLSFIAGGVFFAALPAAFAQEAALTADQVKFFESKIRPVLVEYCYQCHSAEEKIKGGLALDSKEGLKHGGDSGEAIVPGKPEESLLWTAVSWADSDSQMPPKQKLPDTAIAAIKEWIAMGAPDPRETKAVVVKSGIDLEQGRKFWSFQAPVKSVPGELKNTDWARTEVDKFVLAKLEARNLHPAADGAPDVLLRRLHFDLTGLPPSPEDVTEFLSAWKQNAREAYVSKVDELLKSPRFGERWGRHWLDVARYAESTGKEVNMMYPHAWRYRDYVIDSFNADKPYHTFVMEQIAGDLMPIKNDADWQENLIATGFLAIGTKGLNEQNPRQFQMDLVDEQIDAASQAFLGLTVACARCHDHKTDPIPTADYYSLAGIFLSTETFFGTVNQIQNRRSSDLLLLPVKDEVPMKTYTLTEVASMKSRLAELEKEMQELQATERRSRGQGTEARNNLQRIIFLVTVTNQLKAALNGIDENGHAKTFAMGAQDRDLPTNATVLVRGELDKPAQAVPRGFLQVLDQIGTPPASAKGSGRLELAKWMSSAENPLTARVMVNRVWGHLFGEGLVASPDNFGATGTAPTHPELLDYLAVRFMENGWSVKQLIRELVMTRTYQLSSAYDAKNYKVDPDNHYLWRATPRRLDAEALRDSILTVAGTLDLARPHGSLVSQVGDSVVGPRISARTFDRPVLYRSVYLPAVRDALPESMALFDAADGNVVTGARDTTNVASQSLYLMNSPFVIQQADAMAQRIAKMAETPKEQFELAFLTAYGRPATLDEINSAMAFFQKFIPAANRQMSDRTKAGGLAFTAFCQSLMASAEFRYLN